MSAAKPTQIRIRIATEDMPTIEALAGSILSITDVTSLLLSAAVEAVKENEGRLQFPPKFSIAAPDNSPAMLSDKPKKKK